MHVQTGCSGNDSDIVIPSLPCSDRKPADSPSFSMDGLGTKHRVWFQRFGTRVCGCIIYQTMAPIAMIDYIMNSYDITGVSLTETLSH